MHEFSSLTMRIEFPSGSQSTNRTTSRHRGRVARTSFWLVRTFYSLLLGVSDRSRFPADGTASKIYREEFKGMYVRGDAVVPAAELAMNRNG